VVIRKIKKKEKEYYYRGVIFILYVQQERHPLDYHKNTAQRTAATYKLEKEKQSLDKINPFTQEEGKTRHYFQIRFSFSLIFLLSSEVSFFSGSSISAIGMGSYISDRNLPCNCCPLVGVR